jgi:toxin FitB
MIVLDTNVLSELMRPRPSDVVVAWFGTRPANGIYLTSITLAEILYGIALLPAGKRRAAILSASQATFRDFEGRILAFDAGAASAYTDIAADRRRAGRPIATLDAQIAAIARSSGATLATRNTFDFEDCGVKLVDPFAA